MKSTPDVSSGVGADAAEALWIYVTQVNYSLKIQLADNCGRCCIDIIPDVIPRLHGKFQQILLICSLHTSKTRITSPFFFSSFSCSLTDDSSVESYFNL